MGSRPGHTFSGAASGPGAGDSRVRVHAFRACCVAVIWLAVLLEPAQPAFPAAPGHFIVQGPSLEMNGSLAVTLGLEVDNTEILHDMLKNGAAMQLAANVRLERLRPWWTNETLLEKPFVSHLRHNPLTREFLLTMPGEEKPLADRNLERLLAATWHKLTLDIGANGIARHNGGTARYRIILDISLRHTEVPPWLAKTLIFRSWDIVEPITLTLPFTL